jgi:hypothetical protein
MKARVVLLIAVLAMIASSLSLAGVTQTSAQAAGRGRIRIVNAAADAPPIDIYIDGRRWFYRLSYKDFTDFVTLTEGEHEIVIRKGGDKADSQLLFTKQIDVEKDAWVNVVALGLLAGKDATAFDLVTLPGDRSGTKGRGRVEFINAIPESGALDGISKNRDGDDVVFANVGYGKEVVTAELGQSVYNFVFAPAGAKEPVRVNLQEYPVVADVIYTNVLTGTLDKPVVIIMTAGDLYARAVHASPDAPALDIYLNGKKTFENLGFKAATDFATLRSLVYMVELRPAGAAPDTKPIYRRSLRLPAGQTSYLVIMGLLNGQGSDSLRVFLTYTPSFLVRTRARFSVINASPGGTLLDASVAGKLVLRGIEFGNGSGRYVDAGTTDVTIFPFRKTEPALIALKGVALEGDTQYYMLAVNTADKIEAVLLSNKSYVTMKRLAKAAATKPTAVPTATK